MLIRTAAGLAAMARDESASWSLEISAQAWLVVAITALGAGLRFATIADQSYWYDEAATVHLMHLSFRGMLHGVGTQESTPPLYYVLAWTWAKAFGTGAAALRSLLALAGTALIPIAYLCGLSRPRAEPATCVAAGLHRPARSPFHYLAIFAGGALVHAPRGTMRPVAAVLCPSLAPAVAAQPPMVGGPVGAGPADALLRRLSDRPGGARVAVASAQQSRGAGSGAVAAVQAVLVPLAVNDASHPLQGWITQFPLSIRIQQVPVAFGMGTLYQQSAIVADGLFGAALLAACVIVLLLIGADARQLRGTAVAAALAGFVLIVPLLLALAVRDYYIARNLMPAWVALAVVVGGACSAPRARGPGAVLAVLLVGSFVWAQIEIDSNPRYQRPDLRGVAAALGRPTSVRAVVAYQGTFATLPLALYLPRASTPGTRTPAPAVSEVDIVGNPAQTTPGKEPAAGVRLVARATVAGYLVERFALRPAWPVTPALSIRAAELLGPATPSQAAILVQRP